MPVLDAVLFESARMDREMARELGQNYRRRNKTSVLGTALATMSTQRLLILAAGALLLVGGLLALRYPVFLADFDQWGFQINCGSGFDGDRNQGRDRRRGRNPLRGAVPCGRRDAARMDRPRGGGRSDANEHAPVPPGAPALR